jgi:hypothetical protein
MMGKRRKHSEAKLAAIAAARNLLGSGAIPTNGPLQMNTRIS